MFQNNERSPSIATIPVGSQVSSASLTLPGIYFRKRSRIKNVWLVDETGFAASTSNYFSFILEDNEATPVVYAMGSTKTVALPGLSPLALALQAGGGDAFDSGSGLDSDQATGVEVDVPAGTMLNLNVVGAGTGKALTNAVCLVEWYSL